MNQLHHFCLQIKLWLDASFPEGSTGVLLLVASALQYRLQTWGLERWAAARFGSKLAALFVARAPVVLLTTFWGWATVGTLELDTAAKGFAAGVLGPMLLSLLRGRGGPPTSVAGADRADAPSGGPATHTESGAA